MERQKIALQNEMETRLHDTKQNVCKYLLLFINSIFLKVKAVNI